MIAINGKNSLEGLFFDANNSFDSDELRNELIKKTKLEKLNLSFYINIKNDDVMLWLRIKDRRNLYKLNFVDNKFKDNNSNCPKEVIDIINQSKALNYFSHKKEMLKDFFLSQKDYINIDEIQLGYGFYNIPYQNFKDLMLISKNKDCNENLHYSLFFSNLKKQGRFSFLHLSEKELKYVLDNFKAIDKCKIDFRITYKDSYIPNLFESTTLSEVKKDILKIVDEVNKLDNSMQKGLE